jgi:hypothetical protein
MTPEERQQTMDFISASLARLSAAQEQDRHDRVVFENWSSRLLAQTTELLSIQSERMDRMDKVYQDALEETREFHKELLSLENRALRLLNMILDRLPSPERPN